MLISMLYVLEYRHCEHSRTGSVLRRAVRVPPGVRTRTFRSTRKKKLIVAGKGTYVNCYSLQLQHKNLK